MKILFIADLHIRIGQKNIPREWALKQYEIMFDEFNRIYEKHDCEYEVHGGDIFDKVPTMEELSVYINYLHEDRTRSRIIFDGNHEATKKGDTFLRYVEPMVPDDTELFWEYTSRPEYNLDILPYADLHKLKNLKPTSDILLTHVRGAIPPHVKPEVNLDLFKPWKIVFAGDLHAHSNSQLNIVYPGSPRTVSFHRNKVKLGVIVFDTDSPKDWIWEEIKVPQLIRKTITDQEDMIKTEFDHTIYELKGNLLDLSKVDKNSDLLDKKIVNHESTSSLNLTNLSMEEELELYLSKIMNFGKKEIEEIMEVYNANI